MSLPADSGVGRRADGLAHRPYKPRIRRVPTTRDGFCNGPSGKLLPHAMPSPMAKQREPVFRFMGSGLAALVALVLAGCGDDPEPPAPLTTVTTAVAIEPSTSASSTLAASSTVTIPSSVPAETTVSTTSAITASFATSTSSSVPVSSTTSLPPPPTTAEETDPGASLEGKFISVIVSATSEAGARAALEDLEGRFGGEFGVLRSDGFKSLNAGYWVVYAGPFATAAESQDACWSGLNMRTASLCYGRRLSQDPGDVEIVYPPAPAGRDPSPPVTSSPDEGSSAREVYQLVAPSLAYIVNADRTGSGSGILIDGGYIITNYHVVEPYNLVARVVFPDGTELRNVPVVGWAPWADLALLGPVNIAIPPLSLGDGEGMAAGSGLFLVGYPAEPDLYDPQPSITRGVLSRSYREWATGLTVLRTDAAAAGGQSGGAMVDARGEVVGVTMRVVFFRGTAQPVFTEAYSAVDYQELVDRIIRTSEPVPDRRTDTPAEPKTESETAPSLEGRFISVVESATSEAGAEKRRDELEHRFGLRFGILVSADFASLNPGYWVVYAGPFVTAAESQHACWSDLSLRTASLCYGRRLSQDPADREVVYPPAPG